MATRPPVIDTYTRATWIIIVDVLIDVRAKYEFTEDNVKITLRALVWCQVLCLFSVGY